MDFMHYTPRQVANNIIEASFRDGVFITPMKLQRILYLVCSDYAKRAEGTRLFCGAVANLGVWTCCTLTARHVV